MFDGFYTVLWNLRRVRHKFPLLFLLQLLLGTPRFLLHNFLGLASNFKERYRNHQTSFKHRSKRNETELSKYIWDLKDRQKSFHVNWRILRSCQPYSNVSKKCNLCLQEKYFIIFRKDLSSLNKRNELASSCRHRNRLSLKFFRLT